MTVLCKTCIQRPAVYPGTGECHACYKRRRNRDPDVAERYRQSSRAWKAAHREQNRARDREYIAREDVRGKCRSCGGPMGVGSRQDGTCFGCIETAKLENWAEIEHRWKAGESFRDIVAALGWTKGRLGGEMDRMRRAGRDLPYRYKGTKRQRAT